ncbi:12028_t:CDS:2 [Entrophospora sp. SA101]|nr:12028_t:CDS:2 [Entrophospora sp. SA101]
MYDDDNVDDVTGSPSKFDEQFGEVVDEERDKIQRLNMRHPHSSTAVRDYLNKTVVSNLIAGMKKLVIEKPQNPCEFLGRYLIEHCDHNHVKEENFKSEKKNIIIQENNNSLSSHNEHQKSQSESDASMMDIVNRSGERDLRTGKMGGKVEDLGILVHPLITILERFLLTESEQGPCVG